MQEIINIFAANPVGQIFGILGMITVVSAFLQQDDKNVIKLLIFAHFFWGVHFFCMEIYSGLAVTFVGFIRLLMTMKYKRNKNMFYLIIFSTIVLGAFTYEDKSSLLPIIASGLSTYGFFFLERVKLRLVLLLCSSFWFSFHYLHFSIGGVINESIIHIVHLMTIYKIMIADGSTFPLLLKFKRLFTRRTSIDYGRYLAVIDFIQTRKKRR